MTGVKHANGAKRPTPVLPAPAAGVLPRMIPLDLTQLFNDAELAELAELMAPVEPSADQVAFAVLNAATHAAAERRNPGGAPDWDRLERENRLRARSADAGPGVVTKWDGVARMAARARRRAQDALARAACQGARGADLDHLADVAAAMLDSVRRAEAGQWDAAAALAWLAAAGLSSSPTAARGLNPAGSLRPAHPAQAEPDDDPDDDPGGAIARSDNAELRPDLAVRQLLHAPAAPPTVTPTRVTVAAA
jgi:hypothetical protein